MFRYAALGSPIPLQPLYYLINVLVTSQIARTNQATTLASLLFFFLHGGDYERCQKEVTIQEACLEDWKKVAGARRLE